MKARLILAEAKRRGLVVETNEPPLWQPFPDKNGIPHPQRLAYESKADILGYGGQAGGGKTDLLLGLAVTAHQRSVIFRREAKQGRSLIDRSHELLHDKGRFNATQGVWRGLPGDRQIEFAGVKNPNDVLNWRGQPHDYIAIDEADSFLEQQVRFLMGWNRTTVVGQRCRAVLCFNPPASAEGRWLLSFFGPWIDKKHPNPATPGELRWYAMVDKKEIERPNGEPFVCGEETITPRSRTFIPASVLDNPILMATGYVSALQALPEPLRSQLLYGDFSAGLEDDPWQTIPTAWVEAAMARWKPDGAKDARLDAVGVDVARGGAAKTVLTKRYGAWFAPLEKHPGTSTPDGPSVVRLVAVAVRENPNALVNVDTIGIGSSPVDWLKGLNIGRLQAVNFGAHASGKDKSGMLSFVNVRAKSYWMVRELLDPASGEKLAIPPDPELLADLTAVRWKVTVRGVQLEEKSEVSKRIGRSPDAADSFVLSCLLTRG